MTGPLADPGAQLERTALSWQRTALLIALNGALLTHTVPALGSVAVLMGIVTIVAAAVVWLVAAFGYRRGRGRTVAGVLAAHALATRALTVIVCMITVLNVTAILLHE